MPPLEWCRAIRPLKIGAIAKCVGFQLMLYADADNGTNARPGTRRLAWACELSLRSVITALGNLEHCGLIYCVERGQMYGRSGRSSLYSLCLHDGLHEISEDYETWLDRLRGTADQATLFAPGKHAACG